MLTVDEQVKKKIKLEEIMRREVRSLFNKMIFDFKITTFSGQSVRAMGYRSQWESLLDNHYRRVQKHFKGVAVEPADDLRDVILAALLFWREQNKKDASLSIVKTSQNNMDISTAMARQEFSNDGVTDYSARDIGVVAAVMLRRKFRGRESAIISLETQRAAESTKLVEASAVAGLDPVAVVSGRTVKTDATKTWRTRGDKIVRPIHRAVNGQTVRLDVPFIVNGQQLMYPGDMSHGASINNTANCRCASVFAFP